MISQGAPHGKLGPATAAVLEPIGHTTSPIVTGSSVIAMKYKDGVIMAADCLASYGSMARFRSVTRMHKVGDSTIFGASGEYSDFQSLQHMFDDMMTEEFTIDDGATLTPSEVHQVLARVMYNRRSKMNLLWNNVVVCGFKDGSPFLGLVDLCGTNFESNLAATGFGEHLALPIMRRFLEREKNNDVSNITEEEAKSVIEECMRVLYYRDCRASDKIQVAVCDANGVRVTEPYKLETKWDYKGFYYKENA